MILDKEATKKFGHPVYRRPEQKEETAPVTEKSKSKKQKEVVIETAAEESEEKSFLRDE